MVPQWAKAEFLKKAHFYLSNGKSLCGRTFLWNRSGQVIEKIKCANESEFCHICTRKIIIVF